MFIPVFATFSGERDLIAVALQPTTLHCCPLATFPMQIDITSTVLLEKLGFDCRYAGNTLGSAQSTIRLKPVIDGSRCISTDSRNRHKASPVIGFGWSALLGRLREKYEAMMQPTGERLGKIGLRPNVMTTISLLVAVLAAVAYGFGSPILGALGLLFSGFIDMLDGAVARAGGSATRFGAVYDHVLDRYAEFAVLLGIGVGHLADWVWVLFCLFGMVMASFVRAKAESVGGLKSCTVGVAERQEKIIILLFGSLFQPWTALALPLAVIVVGILSHITVLQRLNYTFQQTRGLKVAL